jgi:hypothetical protein
MPDFEEIGPDKGLDSASWANRIEIRTGDELEDLGKRLCESEETIASSYRSKKKSVIASKPTIGKFDLFAVNQEIIIVFARITDIQRGIEIREESPKFGDVTLKGDIADLDLRQIILLNQFPVFFKRLVHQENRLRFRRDHLSLPP